MGLFTHEASDNILVIDDGKGDNQNYPMYFKCTEDGITAHNKLDQMSVEYGEFTTCMSTHRHAN